MTQPACGTSSCPVPTRPPSRLRSLVWPAGTRLHRGHRREHPPQTLVPGTGATRFAPQDGASHVYLATTAIGALLESALHDAAPPHPRIQVPLLSTWAASVVVLREPVRLVDLRDRELGRLSLSRQQLVSTPPVHYPCTRRWAQALVERRVGGQLTHGIVWDSRQAELHARARGSRPALAQLLADHPTEVAVVWSPPAPADLLDHAFGDGLGRLDTGQGWAFIEDLLGLLGIVSDPG